MVEDRIEVLKPLTGQEIGDVIRDGLRVLPRGGGSKPSLSTPPAGFASLDMTSLSGFLEYEPEEMTFTALAGTPIKHVNQQLSKNNQYLPFNPPLVKQGATLGGTVSAGISGSGRYQYGGIRDFLLGIRYIDSFGNIIHSGGKVVKNAAGFDISKLMIGSRGGLGVLLELSLKVFPLPDEYVTLGRSFAGLSDALDAISQIGNAGLNLAALDVEVTPTEYRIWARLGGDKGSLAGRRERLVALVEPDEELTGPDEQRYWSMVNNIDWIEQNRTWVVVPIAPSQITVLEQTLQEIDAPRRYISGGQALWIGLNGSLDVFSNRLIELELSGLALTAIGGKPILGMVRSNPFLQRIKSAMDPEGCFVEV